MRGRIATALLGALLVASLLAAAPVRAGDEDHRAIARDGMVVSAERHASEAGIEMLRAGGNAIDAAVAVGFALAVTYPAAGNLGGGGFLVAVLGEEGKRQAIALDFRETAPAAAHPDLYVDARKAGNARASTVGHLAAGTPGSVAGLLHALERWGTLDRKIVLAPAIRLAKEGFPLGEGTARRLAAPPIAALLRQYPETLRVFYGEDGKAPAAGTRFRQPHLAHTLERIASQGRIGFYEGPVAAAISQDMSASGGIITLEDLRSYRAVERTPIRFDFHGHTIVSMPPPSSGGVCLQQILGMLELSALDPRAPATPATLHRLVEAMRRSFADRNRFLGDPDHVELPLARLLSAEHIAELANSIDPHHATPSARLLDGGAPPREREETTHYSVVDRHGNSVAVTTTLNGAFGCGVTVPGCGFLLNNEMDDFAAEPGVPNLYGLVQGEANAVAPGKRPLSSMTPTVVLDRFGEPVVVAGTPGGPTIITNVVQVLLGLLVFDLDPLAAVAAPKVHHQCVPDRLDHEPGVRSATRRALEKLGHTLRERQAIGDFQLIVVDRTHGRITGVSDPRGTGAARGL